MADYEIGFKKPPKKNQFRKGRSGNPGGRPRKPPETGSADDAEIMRRLDALPVVVRGRAMTWREAEIHRLWELAVGGEARATRLLNKLRMQPRRADGGGVKYLPWSYWLEGTIHGHNKKEG